MDKNVKSKVTKVTPQRISYRVTYTVQDIIRAIETKSEGGGYIYRGEPKHLP